MNHDEVPAPKLLAPPADLANTDTSESETDEEPEEVEVDHATKAPLEVSSGPELSPDLSRDPSPAPAARPLVIVSVSLELVLHVSWVGCTESNDIGRR